MTTFTFTDGPDNISAGDTPGNNRWNMLKGEDFLLAGIGNDVIFGGNGDDHLDGNRGNDQIFGGDGHDVIFGGRGQDVLYGDNGNDELWDNGDNQPDRMVGGAGNDRLITDGGRMRLGTGQDTLVVDLEAPTNGVFSVTHALDFKAEDHLSVSSTTPQGFLDQAAILDLLDRNNDGWLDVKDEEQSSSDGFSVNVANGNLDLEIDFHDVIFHGITKASFDFLS
jgi:hypothetical protein